MEAHIEVVLFDDAFLSFRNKSPEQVLTGLAQSDKVFSDKTLKDCEKVHSWAIEQMNRCNQESLKIWKAESAEECKKVAAILADRRVWSAEFHTFVKRERIIGVEEEMIEEAYLKEHEWMQNPAVFEQLQAQIESTFLMARKGDIYGIRRAAQVMKNHLIDKVTKEDDMFRQMMKKKYLDPQFHKMSPLRLIDQRDKQREQKVKIWDTQKRNYYEKMMKDLPQHNLKLLACLQEQHIAILNTE